MIPRSLLAHVTAFLAVEGYSLLTAPASLIRAVVSRLEDEARSKGNAASAT